MVEPISMTLGAAAVALLVKAVEKAADRGAEAVVDAVPDVVGNVVKWLRRRFADRGELTQLEQVPDSPRLQQQMAEVIDGELADDESARRQLTELLENVRHANVGGTYQTGTISADRGGVAAAHIAGDIHTGYTEASTGGGGADDPPRGAERP